MRAIVSDGKGGFSVEEQVDPTVGPGEIVVRVEMASVGPRDRRLAGARAGLRPGSDFVGLVEQVAGRSGPQVGARVVGVVPSGAWAERIAVSPRAVCLLPHNIESAAASAAASTGLTALYALERSAGLIGRRVLVTAANGAVGYLAAQLARHSGADVVGWVRHQDARESLRDVGITTVLGPTLAEAKVPSTFDLIIDMVGGEALATSLTLIKPGGQIVIVGASSGERSIIDAALVYQSCTNIAGFGLFPELAHKPAGDGLGRLFGLVALDNLRMPKHSVQSAFASDGFSRSANGGRTVLDFT